MPPSATPRLLPAMQRKFLLPLVALAVGLVCAGLVLLSGSDAPPIKVGLTEITPSLPWPALGDVASFEYTNATRTRYRVYPIMIECRETDLWRSCFECDPLVNDPKALLPGGHMGQSFLLTNLPTGAAVRLKYRVETGLPGLKGLYRRFQLRFVSGQKDLSLNPFDISEIFSSPTEMVSDEFTLPSNPPSAQRSPRADPGSTSSVQTASEAEPSVK